MAFALLSRSQSKTQSPVKPAPKQKSARGQRPADSRLGFAEPVFQPQTAALPTVPMIQAKLKVGEPDDEFEQEADRVAGLTENDNGSFPPSAAAQSRNAVGRLQRLYSNQPVLQMRNGSGGLPAPLTLLRPSQSGILQRKCACGGAAGMSGECEECSKKQRLGLQTKLKINEPGDSYEQEADRIADQVLATPAHPVASGAPPRIQCFSGQSTGQMDAAPASVDRALASPGKPLEPALRQDMEQRFGYDFSRVRVHTGGAAEQSARDVNAHAYTVGSHVVFAEGQYGPAAEQGRKLLAHELTHTIQQSSSASAIVPSPGSIGPGPVDTARERTGERGTSRLENNHGTPALSAQTILQRAPANEPKEIAPQTKFATQVFDQCSSVLSSPYAIFQSAGDDPLYFAQRGRLEEGCTSCHPTVQRPTAGPIPVEHERVTESSILEWARTHIWFEAIDKGLSKKRFFSLLQRREDKALDAIWESYRDGTIAIVASDLVDALDRPIFHGSDTARCRFAKYLHANWNKVILGLHQAAEDWLVREINDILHSRVIPPGATLVTGPARIKQIEETPETGTVELDRHGATATVGFEWVGKRMKSVSSSSLFFEVLGHEGIYFEISTGDFQETDPFVGKLAGDVVKGTKGIAIVGKFIKGFLNALVLFVLDTSAKIIDMATQGISYAGKRWGWYDIGYTCISSTCQQYEACLESNKSADECQSAAITAAVEEATIIIPLYRKGRDCLVGQDAEACGSIATLALGLVKVGGKPLATLTKVEFEEAAIRGAIGRPRPGDIRFARELERPKGPKEPPGRAKLEPPVRIKKPSRPTRRPAEELVTERVVHEAASQAGSEVKLGDGTHGVAAYGKGKKAGFQFCSDHCALVADKLEQIEKVLPEKSLIQRDVRFLKNKARALDKEVARGKLTKEQADQAARDIAQGLRDQSGTAVFDTLLQMSPEDIQANRASLKKQVSRALERGKEITKEIAADQDVTGVLEDPKARTRVTKKPSPGRQPRQFLRGNFAHRFAEFIFDRQRTQRTHGPSALPRPSEAEVVIALRDGTGDIIRADRIVRNANQGVLIEIKPAGVSADIGRTQLPGRIAALQREFPKKNGWVGRVIEYTRADVEAWLRAENVPDARIPEIMAELGF